MTTLEVLRRQKEISQRNLALKLGLSEFNYCRIERGWYAKPPRGTEDKLREYFGQQWTWANLMKPVVVSDPQGEATHE